MTAGARGQSVPGSQGRRRWGGSGWGCRRGIPTAEARTGIMSRGSFSDGGRRFPRSLGEALRLSLWSKEPQAW